jgi:dolichol-phosphate mannosyltransferase
VITLDGDGQNDPADIPRLVAEFHASGRSHLICGYRRQRQDTVLRRLSSRIANAVRSRLLGDATPDTGCGLKVMPRDLFMRLPRFDHMHRFLPALALREGARVTSVVVSHRARRFGRSSYGVWNRLWVGVVDLFGVMWLKRRAFRAAVSEEMNDGC